MTSGISQLDPTSRAAHYLDRLTQIEKTVTPDRIEIPTALHELIKEVNALAQSTLSLPKDSECRKTIQTCQAKHAEIYNQIVVNQYAMGTKLQKDAQTAIAALRVPGMEKLSARRFEHVQKDIARLKEANSDAAESAETIIQDFFLSGKQLDAFARTLSFNKHNANWFDNPVKINTSLDRTSSQSSSNLSNSSSTFSSSLSSWNSMSSSPSSSSTFSSSLSSLNPTSSPVSSSLTTSSISNDADALEVLSSLGNLGIQFPKERSKRMNSSSSALTSSQVGSKPFPISTAPKDPVLSTPRSMSFSPDKQMCLIAIGNALTNPKFNLVETLEIGEKVCLGDKLEIPEEIAPLPNEGQWDFYLTPGSQSYVAFIDRLEKLRASKNLSSIGAMLTVFTSPVAIFITKKNNDILISIFNPSAKSKATVNEFTYMELAADSLADWMRYMPSAGSNNQRNRCTVDAFALKKEMSQTDAPSSKSSSSSSSSSMTSSLSVGPSITAPAQISQSTVSLLNLTVPLGDIQTRVDSTMPDQLKEAVKQLCEMEVEIPMGKRSVSMIGLYYFHLHCIQIKSKHPIKKVEHYISKAAENQDGCTSTRLQRNQALLRLRAQVLLIGLKQAYLENNLSLANSYVQAINRLGEDLERANLTTGIHKFIGIGRWADVSKWPERQVAMVKQRLEKLIPDAEAALQKAWMS